LQLKIACWDNKVDVASHGTIRAIAFRGYDANRCPCLPSHTSTMTTALMEDKIIHYQQLRASSTNLLLSGDKLIMQSLQTSRENSTRESTDRNSARIEHSERSPKRYSLILLWIIYAF
jgi:hypothetical protein